MKRRRARVPPTRAASPSTTRYFVFPCGCTTIGSRAGELVARCTGTDCYLVKSGRA